MKFQGAEIVPKGGEIPTIATITRWIHDEFRPHNGRCAAPDGWARLRRP
jgi:hypothetical protein